MKIYIAIFNKKSNIDKEGYYCLQVGAKQNPKITELCDDSGDNISYKNINYSEVTGLYWIWKNSSEDIVGLTHYRRFFYNNSIVFEKRNVLSKSNIEKILKNYDAILPEKGYLKKTVGESYKDSHVSSDLDACEKVIGKLYPDYSSAFTKVMNKKNYHAFNMIITKKEVFDNYCNWLFPILFELEKELDTSDREMYNGRVYGFLSERLLNVWFEKNSDLKIIEKPVYNIEQNMNIQIGRSLVKKIYRRIK